MPTLASRRAEFLKRLAERFGSAVTFIGTEYRGQRHPTPFRCVIHGAFERKPCDVLGYAKGCPFCGPEQHLAKVRRTPEEKRAAALARWRRQRARRLKSGSLAASVKRWRARIKATDPERWSALLKANRPGHAIWLKTEKGRKHGRLQRQRRRARLNDLTSLGVTAAQWDAICAAHANDVGEVCCRYCKQPCSPTVDHVVPIARGGRHEPGNVVPACGRCNSSKCAHLIHEWPKARRLLTQGELAALVLHTTRHLNLPDELQLY